MRSTNLREVPQAFGIFIQAKMSRGIHFGWYILYSLNNDSASEQRIMYSSVQHRTTNLGSAAFNVLVHMPAIVCPSSPRRPLVNMWRDTHHEPSLTDDVHDNSYCSSGSLMVSHPKHGVQPSHRRGCHEALNQCRTYEFPPEL
jgi:hypothetical protein